MKVIVFLLFGAMILSIWSFLSVTSILGVVFVFLIITVAILSIFKKQRETYLQSKITRVIFVYNIFLEISGIILAMALAGLLGRYIAHIATENIINNLAKLIAGIAIGLLAGMGVGLLVKRMWERFVKLQINN